MGGMCARTQIEKKTTSQERRYIGILGLEHTGHHLWTAIFDEHLNQTMKNRQAQAHLDKLYEDLLRPFILDGGLPCANITMHVDSVSRAWRSHARFASTTKHTGSSQIELVPLSRSSPSFPSSRRLWNPDYTLWAMASELAQVDLRFV